MTASRKELLQRALASYIQETKKTGRDIEYVVFDDSKDAQSRSASLEVAKNARRRFDVEVRFAGFEERAAYVRRLRDCSSLPAGVLEFGLLLTSGYTLGQNRNAMLLDSVGKLFLCVDDDTICSPRSPPATNEQGREICSDADPSEFWCFRDFAEALRSAAIVEHDVLEAHEQLLGKNVADLPLSGAHASPQDGKTSSPRLQRPENTVRVTLNGLVGDCAWGSPFGLWHEPMGYLAFTGSSLARLTRSEEIYQQAIQSRQLMRATSCRVLADATFSMLTFWGLDNRELLPPNLPINRGQDIVFGQILWKCFDDVVFGHVPLALVHDPVQPRRFWPGEVTRSAAGVDLCRLMVEATRLCKFHEHSCDPARRLQTLGQHLMGLAELSGKALQEKLTERLRESNRRFERVLEQQALEVTACSGYSSDLARFLEKLRKSEAREYYWIPFDLWSVAGPAATETRLRETFKKFGTLLALWPSIVKAARELLSRGIRLSVPV